MSLGGEHRELDRDGAGRVESEALGGQVRCIAEIRTRSAESRQNLVRQEVATAAIAIGREDLDLRTDGATTVRELEDVARDRDLEACSNRLSADRHGSNSLGTAKA